MATISVPADQASELLQKLSLDAQPKALEMPEPTKKPSAKQYASADCGNAANGQVLPIDRSMTPVMEFDPNMCYLPNGYPSAAYYYGGYDETANDWEDYSRYANAEVVDMTNGLFGDNASLIYHHGYGYSPYGPYSPAATPVPGNDQLYGTQHYHYPSPFFQPLTPTSAPYSPSPAAPQGGISTSAATDHKLIEAVNANSNATTNVGVKGVNGSSTVKSTNQNSYNSNGSYGRGALTGSIASGYQDPRFAFDGVCSPIPWIDASVFSDGQSRPVSSAGMSNSVSNANNVQSSRNQPFRPNSHFMGLQHPRPISGIEATNAFMNRIYPNKFYGQYGSAVRSGIGYGQTGRGWFSFDNKYKNKGRGDGYYGYGNEGVDGLNELNRGPRAKTFKNPKTAAPVAIAVKGQALPTDATSEEANEKKIAVPDREQYNIAEFPEEYANAKFFIIKSYSEDDVHKSIKYNVWASTPNGNKKLDAAYKESQEKDGGCPVFLFFSVNTSGQFVGVAEMTGPVDFHRNVEFWQQDKWYGCFPVKWHIVKDVPNISLKHIILENNENKPVTNSRDTQEVRLEHGLKMVKIFKEYSSKTCLLDDFEFYENRQKAIQEKKAKQQQVKQVWEGKLSSDKRDPAISGELKSEKSLEVAQKEAASQATNGVEEKHSDEGLAGDGVTAVPEKKEVVANGVVAHGC